ncbi:MAG: hypothetical protein DMG69_10630 [Acidobacteria bacterium]|nr:MAG: hypothetical protein DMG69_10630 [Acidobacteriota bacterium]
MKIVEGIPLAFAPRTKWSYSNLVYLTLGVLIRHVSGKNLWRLPEREDLLNRWA